MGGVKGDFAKLGNLQKEIAKLGASGPGSLYERMCRAAAAEALTQVQLEFKRSVDPNGKPWKPLKHRDGMPLRDTGRLNNSFTAQPTARGFAIGTNVTYAIYHQRGTKGRHADSSRSQAVDKRGRFTNKAKGARKVSGAVLLTFRTGTGGIPARPMIPEPGLSPMWKRAIDKATKLAADKYLGRLKT